MITHGLLSMQVIDWLNRWYLQFNWFSPVAIIWFNKTKLQFSFHLFVPFICEKWNSSPFNITLSPFPPSNVPIILNYYTGQMLWRRTLFQLSFIWFCNQIPTVIGMATWCLSSTWLVTYSISEWWKLYLLSVLVCSISMHVEMIWDWLMSPPFSSLLSMCKSTVIVWHPLNIFTTLRRQMQFKDEAFIPSQIGYIFHLQFSSHAR